MKKYYDGDYYYVYEKHYTGMHEIMYAIGRVIGLILMFGGGVIIADPQGNRDGVPVRPSGLSELSGFSGERYLREADFFYAAALLMCPTGNMNTYVIITNLLIGVCYTIPSKAHVRKTG